MYDDFPTLHGLTTQPDGAVAYHPVCDPAEDAPPQPDFAFGEPADDIMAGYRQETHRGPAGVYVATDIGLFERALLFRGDMVLRCEEIGVTRQNVVKFLPHWRAMSGMIHVRNEPGRCVLLLGRGYHVWGHWLVDFLPKLWLLRRAGYDLMQLNYLVPDDTPGFGLEILDMVGITAERRVVYDHQREFVRAEELLVPTLVRTGNRATLVLRDAVTFATSLIRSGQPAPPAQDGSRLIFVSRGLLTTQDRRLLNRDRVERLAEAAGFGIIHPETLRPREQFALFAGARHIAGDYGSALHTSIFSDPATTVCGLRGTALLPGFVQSAIGEALGQRTGYIFGAIAAGDRTESFTIDEAAFEAYLALVLSEATSSA